MRKHVCHSIGLRLYLWLLAAVVSVGLVPPAHSSKFWGIIGSDSINNFANYPAEAETLAVMAARSMTGSGPSRAGWGLLDFREAPFPLEVVRDTHAVYVITTNPPDPPDTSGIPLYLNARDSALAHQATLVLGHARGSQIVVPGPHPFLYRRVDDFRALMHNGTIADQTELAQAFGAGFAALDSFVNRRWAGWRTMSPNDTTIDTEYYAAMYMKRLLIAENYYWPMIADAMDTKDLYAIQTALTDVRFASPDYGSVNAAIACKDTVWLVYKKVNPTGDPAHTVSYWSPAGGAFRMVSTMDRPTTSGWFHVRHAGQYGNTGKIVRLCPGVDIDTSDVYPFTLAQGQYLRPAELRINPERASVGDQTSPAICADTARGSFAVVWKEGKGNDIEIRWYNQMGLAVGNEFRVNQADPTDVRSPAIAHSPNGDTVMVVWCEKPVGSSLWTSVKARRLWWVPEELTWHGSTETLLNASGNQTVDNPSVALRADGGYAVVWQHTDALTGRMEIRWSAASLSNTVSNLRLSAGSSLLMLRPDVTALLADTAFYAVVYAKSTFGPDSGFVNCRVVTGATLGLGSEQVIHSQTGSAKALSPAVGGSATVNGFVVGYYSGTIMAKHLRTDGSGNLTVQATIRGETTTGVKRLDVSERDDRRFETVYDKYDGVVNGTEVFAAIQNDSLFGTPWRVNRTTAEEQSLPAMAISQYFHCNSVNHPDSFYYQISDDTGPFPDGHVFGERRVVVWQSRAQDGGGWGIVGRFYGINANTDTAGWYDPDRLNGGAATGKAVTDDEGTGTAGMNHKDPDGPKSNLDEGAEMPRELLPERFELYVPYPNPFNATTVVRFDVPVAGRVRLDVYDLTGRVVQTLTNQSLRPGTYGVPVHASDLSSGTYFVRLEAEGFEKVQKMLLLR